MKFIKIEYSNNGTFVFINKYKRIRHYIITIFGFAIVATLLIILLPILREDVITIVALYLIPIFYTVLLTLFLIRGVNFSLKFLLDGSVFSKNELIGNVLMESHFFTYTRDLGRYDHGYSFYFNTNSDHVKLISGLSKDELDKLISIVESMYKKEVKNENS